MYLLIASRQWFTRAHLLTCV